MGEHAQRIKELREQALSSMTTAREIKTELSGQATWPADKQEAFDRAIADFERAHAEANQLEQRDAAVDTLERHYAGYTERRESVQHRAPDSSPEARQTQEQHTHREAYRRYLRMGQQGLSGEEYSRYIQMSPQETQALVGNVDNLGGFLIPDEDFNELIREEAGFAVMRPMCRTRRTSRQVGVFMTVAAGTNPYPSGVSGAWRVEGYVTGGAAPPTQDQPQFGRQRVPTHIWQPDVIELTVDLLEDSSINLETEIRALLAETKALDEDSAFILGSGNNQPMGILTQPGITEINSGAAAGQTYAGIINLYTGLPAQYRPRASWLMNSHTYGLLLLVEDDQGRPLFPVNQLINQLLNRPIAFSEFMPNGSSAGANAIVFGDFSYYGIVDRRDLRVQRLTERFAPNIGILATGRVGGQPLKTTPFRKQKVAA